MTQKERKLKIDIIHNDKGKEGHFNWTSWYLATANITDRYRT